MAYNHKYIRGVDLTEHEIDRVKAAFVHRDTVEHPWNSIAREFLYTTVGQVPTDANWINSKAFRFFKSGEAAGCLPLAAVTADMLHERSQYAQA